MNQTNWFWKHTFGQSNQAKLPKSADSCVPPSSAIKMGNKNLRLTMVNDTCIYWREQTHHNLFHNSEKYHFALPDKREHTVF